MVSHLQLKYIITEKQLEEVLSNSFWGRTNCEKFKARLKPYNFTKGTDQP